MTKHTMAAGLLSALLALMFVAGGCDDDAVPANDAAGVEDGATEDGAIEDSAIEDSGVDDSAIDDGAIDDGAIEDSAVDGSAFLPDACSDAGPDATPDAEIRPCGDDVCANDEDCASCPVDCGSCPLTWTPLSSGALGVLEAVHFPVNAAVGFAAGEGGAVVRTSDGGDTWISLDSGTSATLRGLDFVDEQTGYAVGDSGTLIKTSNGGTNWGPLTSGTNLTLRAVDFVDEALGHVVGDAGLTATTLNGGVNWTSTTPITTEPLFDVNFIDAQRGFAVGGAGALLVTDNGGANWSLLASGTTQTLRGVAFALEGQVGYAVGDAGTIIKTSNGGTSWGPLDSGTTADLWAVDFPLDELHGHAVGDGGVMLRTIDGGTNWQREDAQTTENLRGVAFPAYWTFGYAVGGGGTAVKRVPPWDDSVVYDTEVANLTPPTIEQGNVYVVNSRGFLFALRPTDRIALYKPVVLDDQALNRSPAAPLADETQPTVFTATASGIGYAVDGDSGAIRWVTDADATTPGVQRLGDSLVAVPRVSPPLNRAFFATANSVGEQNRIFAFDAKTGDCQWVLNGDCDGATGSLGLGRINGAPVHDSSATRLYVTSTSLDGGDTVWAVNTSDTNPGEVQWSRDLGSISASPAFASGLASLFVGTEDGRVYRVQAADGVSCWSDAGSGCGDFVGNEQAFCTATDSRSNTCTGGSGVRAGFFSLFTGAERIVFVTVDGHVRMIDADGQLLWKTTTPIAGASFPVVLPDSAQPENGEIFIGSSDGSLHRLDLATGAAKTPIQVGDGRAIVGNPSVDFTTDTLYVGTGFGLLHRFPVRSSQ